MQTPSTPLPSPDTDNWTDTSLDAPRQKAGDAIERESHAKDSRDIAGEHDDAARTSADAEATAERRATDPGSVESA